jgi:membrane associated rhomboid family serine protease
MGRKSRPGSTLDAVEVSATILLIMFAMYYVNLLFFGNTLNLFGIVPRTGWGLLGILVSPLLHYNAVHLTANAISLFILLVFLFSHREYRADYALLTIWLLSGIGTWLIGRPAIHIGASSIIYGVVVYLIVSAWWLRSWRSAIIAVVVLVLYGGIFYGVLPRQGIISWEGHLSGAISGFLAARQQHR